MKDYDMRSIKVYVGSICAVVFCVINLHADILLNWQCDDGVAGTQAGIIANVNGNTALNGTAVSQSGGDIPVFSDVIPAPVIWSSSFGGVLLNSNNTTSLKFTNAGLPEMNNYSGGKVYLNDTNALHLGDQTVELFVKIDRPVDWSHIFAKQRYGGNKTWLMEVSSTGYLKLRMDTQPDGQFNQVAGGSFIEDGQWHHLAFTYEESTRYAKLYIDYILVSQMTVAADLVYMNYPLSLGGGANKPFDGWIDEVRICDSVLEPVDFMTTNAPCVITEEYVYCAFDGEPGEQSDLVPCELYDSCVKSYSSVVGTGVLKPVYNVDVAEPIMLRIQDGVNGEMINNSNETSLQFVNSGNENADDVVASRNGSVVNIVGPTIPFAMTNFTAEIFMKVNRHVDYSVIMAKTRIGGFSWAVNVLPSGRLRVRTDTQLPGDPMNTSAGFNLQYCSGAEGYVEDGKWHHVALTYDAAANNARLYLDYEVLLDFTPAVNAIYFDDGNYLLGAGDRAFDGLLDEFRLSNKVLQPEQFLQIVPDGPLIFIN